MPRSVSPSFTIAILLIIGTASCTTIAPVPTATPTVVSTVVSSSPTPEPLLTPSAEPIPISSPETWTTYSSSDYSFSISLPTNLEIAPGANTPTLYVGDQIHVWISDTDPLQCRGDCLLVESTGPATGAGLDATRVAGYMGAIGGSIPQRYLRYILRHDDRYYVFTLFALGRGAKNECCSTIWPLNENDIALFDQILGTLKFTN
jgi:hypothetical protein